MGKIRNEVVDGLFTDIKDLIVKREATPEEAFEAVSDIKLCIEAVLKTDGNLDNLFEEVEKLLNQ